MIQKLQQVMVYVNDQQKVADFWTQQVGFTMIAEEQHDMMRWIEIAPTAQNETTIILHDKALIEKLSPELNFGTPSLMFTTDDIDALYAKLTQQEVTVGELVTIPAGRVFNFADPEGNYFAVMQPN